MKYTITAPTQQRWVESEHKFVDLPPYDSSVTPNKNIFGVTIINGEGKTDSALVAVEFFDMGYIVDPDPHAEAMEIIAKSEAQKEVAEIVSEQRREVLSEMKKKELLEEMSPTNKKK